MRSACGFFAGRRLQQVCSEMFALTKPGALVNERDIISYCDYAMAASESCKPRVLKAGSIAAPVHVFTDGAWEGGVASLGSVVVDTLNGQSMVFSRTPT